MQENTAFASTDFAHISSGLKTFTKAGKVVIADGHIGLLRENGDLIASAPVAAIQVNKAKMYDMMPNIIIVVNGKKYRVMMSWNAYADTVGDQQAREIQAKDNEELFTVVRELGGAVG